MVGEVARPAVQLPRAPLVAVVALCLVSIVGGCSTGARPVDRLPVGVTYFTLEDPSRLEPVTTDPSDHRWIGVYAWYPAAATAGTESMRYVDADTADRLHRYLGIPRFMFLRQEPSLAGVNAEAASGRFPVLIFNHGFASYPTQNALYAEALAARGYVVLSIGHPFESLWVSDGIGGGEETATTDYFDAVEAVIEPDPAAYVADRQRAMEEVRAASDDAAARRAIHALASDEPIGRLLADHLEVWVADTLLLLESLPLIDGGGASALAGTLDTDAVGLFGHSFGGTVSLELAIRVGTPGIDAVVNYDGPGYFWEADADRVPKSPLLVMTATRSAAARKSVLDTTGVNDWYVELAQADAWSLTVPNASHHQFTDLTFVPMTRAIGLTGPVDGKATGEVIIDTTARFFDAYLRNGPPFDLSETDSEFSVIVANRH